MTILLAHVTDDRVLVAVDTLGYWPQGGAPTECPKMQLLPMLDAIVAVSGETDVLGAIYNLLLPPPGADFDSLGDEAQKGLIDRAVELVWRAREERALPVWPEQAVLIAGYSKREKRCRALLSHHERHGGPPTLREIGHLVAPPLKTPRVPSSREAMLEIAREIVALQRPQGLCVGGRLIIAEAAASGISCSVGVAV